MCATRTYAIARNQSEIMEIWLEIRNQGLENPVEISEKSREIRKKVKSNQEILDSFCLSMRSRPFAHAHLRNPREITREIRAVGNQLEIKISWKSQKSGNLVRREGPCRTVPLAFSKYVRRGMLVRLRD